MTASKKLAVLTVYRFQVHLEKSSRFQTLEYLNKVLISVFYQAILLSFLGLTAMMKMMI